MITHILKLLWNKKGTNALMMLEIFLAFLVLFFAIAYAVSQLEKVTQPLGYEYENRYLISLSNELQGIDSLQKAEICENLKRELLAEEKVEKVAFFSHVVPFKNNNSSTTTDDNGFEISSMLFYGTHEFDEVLGIEATAGRTFNEDDVNQSIYKPIMVNQAFMDKYYPGKSMIDSTLKMSGDRRIVGVVDEIKYRGAFGEREPTTIVISSNPERFQHAIVKVHPGTDVAYEEKLLNIVNSTTKLNTNMLEYMPKMKEDNDRNNWIILIAVLSICAFLCINVALGLFGVLSYQISKRKAEVGLRQALGAHSTDIAGQFIWETLLLAGLSIALGIFFCIQVPLLNVTEYPDSIFYKSILYSTLVILGLVLICALLPSLQASRITPANSLHED